LGSCEPPVQLAQCYVTVYVYQTSPGPKLMVRSSGYPDPAFNYASGRRLLWQDLFNSVDDCWIIWLRA